MQTHDRPPPHTRACTRAHTRTQTCAQSHKYTCVLKTPNRHTSTVLRVEKQHRLKVCSTTFYLCNEKQQLCTKKKKHELVWRERFVFGVDATNTESNGSALFRNAPVSKVLFCVFIRKVVETKLWSGCMFLHLHTFPNSFMKRWQRGDSLLRDPNRDCLEKGPVK